MRTHARTHKHKSLMLEHTSTNRNARLHACTHPGQHARSHTRTPAHNRRSSPHACPCTHVHPHTLACTSMRASTRANVERTRPHCRAVTPVRATNAHPRTHVLQRARLCVPVYGRARAPTCLPAHSNNASTRAHTHALARAHTQGSTRAVCDERCRRGRGRSAWSATPELPAPTGVGAPPPPHSSNTCPPRHTHIHLHSRM